MKAIVTVDTGLKSVPPSTVLYRITSFVTCYLVSWTLFEICKYLSNFKYTRNNVTLPRINNISFTVLLTNLSSENKISSGGSHMKENWRKCNGKFGEF